MERGIAAHPRRGAYRVSNSYRRCYLSAGDTPTSEDLLYGAGFTTVSKIDEAGWRHGVDRKQVWRRDADGTFWASAFKVSTDGETHELRDGEAPIYQVWPHEVKTVVYRSRKEDADVQP